MPEPTANPRPSRPAPDAPPMAWQSTPPAQEEGSLPHLPRSLEGPSLSPLSPNPG